MMNGALSMLEAKPLHCRVMRSATMTIPPHHDVMSFEAAHADRLVELKNLGQRTVAEQVKT